MEKSQDFLRTQIEDVPAPMDEQIVPVLAAMNCAVVSGKPPRSVSASRISHVVPAGSSMVSAGALSALTKQRMVK